MKKLLSLLLVMVLCFSACAVFAEEAAPEAAVAEEAVAEEAVAEEAVAEEAVAEEAVAEEVEAEAAEPEPETITVANSFADYELTPPEGVSLYTKRKGDITTLTFGGAVDSVEVQWKGEDNEVLTVENNVATVAHAGHKYQEGISWVAKWTNWYWIDTFATEEEANQAAAEMGLEKYVIEQWDEDEWDLYEIENDGTAGGDDAYLVTIGDATFVHSRTGKINSIRDKRENANFFRSGVASTATITWRRTVDGKWFPKTIEETYEDGEITKVVALFKNDKGKSLVHYVVTFDDGDDGVYTVKYGANDKYYGVSAKKDDVNYINGSAKYKNRWVNSSTYKWAPADAGLRDIADFATSPRTAE